MRLLRWSGKHTKKHAHIKYEIANKKNLSAELILYLKSFFHKSQRKKRITKKNENEFEPP